MCCEPECTAIVFTAMSQMPENNQVQTLYAEKMSAFILLLNKCNYYQKEGFLPELIIEICRKKAEFIKEAKTKHEIKMILKPLNLRYNGNEILPANEYCIPEEEIIFWSMTSLLSPLTAAGQKRYEKLFKQLFPDKMEIFNP